MPSGLRWRFRSAIAQAMGASPCMALWSSPDIPLVYVNNPKCGCSTIKGNLKALQAAIYEAGALPFHHNPDPHIDDDCLRRTRLPARACRSKFLISCVRNPLSRTLSAYLDKVRERSTPGTGEFAGRNITTFEDFLESLSDCDPVDMNTHFRPQHINLCYPQVTYDLIFFLENLPLFGRLLQRLKFNHELRRIAPHARAAASKLQTNYTDRALALVEKIYAPDFKHFGYTLDLSEAHAPPATAIIRNEFRHDSALPDWISPDPDVISTKAVSDILQRTLLYRRLVDLKLC